MSSSSPPGYHMTIGEHLNELRSRLMHVALLIVIVSIFAMTFQLKPFEIGKDIYLNFIGTKKIVFYYPYPNTVNNLAAQIIRQMEKTLLPPNVRTIQTAPGQAFTTELYISMLIGIIVSVPLMVKEVFEFIFPAFAEKTRTAILKMFIPSLLLFVAGATFAYLYLVPFTIEFLYRYGQSLDVVSFFNIADFIPFVLQFLLGVGFAFELPILMYAISLTGLVDEKFWKNNFRYAVLAFAIFGAIITPDGSGVTMWFVALPMILLYLIGMFAIRRKRIRQETQSLSSL